MSRRGRSDVRWLGGMGHHLFWALVARRDYRPSIAELFLATFGAWVTIIQGVIFVIGCFDVPQNGRGGGGGGGVGIVGVLAAGFKRAPLIKTGGSNLQLRIPCFKFQGG